MTDSKPYATAGASAASANKRCGRNRIIWHALPVFVLALWVMFLLLSSPTSHDDSPPSPHLYTILDSPDTAPIDSHLVLPTQRPEPILPSPPQTPVLPPQPPRRSKETDAAAEADACEGRYIYAHNLPPKFNADLLRDCRSLSNWTNMCLFTSNGGLGPPLQGYPGGRGSSWYATNQFALDVIFHERMKNQYPCLTRRSSLASAVFVPFYAGLEVDRNLWAGRNSSALDAAALDLMQWLRARPEWERMGGRDHFFVAGRITWDFRRLNDDNPAWGSRLLLMPEGRNMTALVLESSPWHSNDVAIPYPTYFHPKSESEVEQWQSRLRGLSRPWLFSFAGGGRPGMKSSIRGQIIQQCQASKHCRLLDCSSNKQSSSCHSPGNVMRLFERSVFCLQPQGDSYTRRSAFDAMVAGCIPVFFHPGSAYVQYQWHLPAQGYGNYSVFIPEDEVRQRNSSLKIEQVLANIGEEKAAVMRENVIGLIPRLVYADPRVQWGSGGSIKDAFDTAVDGMLKRVATIRGEVTGTASGNSDANTKFEEHNSWKAALGAANQGPHEWDRFFS